MKFVNWFIDTVYDLLEYLIMLLVVAIAVIIILWRLDGLFNADIPLLSSSSKAIESTIQTTRESLSDILGSTSLEGEVIEVKIPENASLESISNILFQYGLIQDKAKFEEYMKNNDLINSIKPATYEITVGNSIEEIAKIITQ